MNQQTVLELAWKNAGTLRRTCAGRRTKLLGWCIKELRKYYGSEPQYTVVSAYSEFEGNFVCLCELYPRFTYPRTRITYLVIYQSYPRIHYFHLHCKLSGVSDTTICSCSLIVGNSIYVLYTYIAYSVLLCVL